jgi:hypothetical protein
VTKNAIRWNVPHRRIENKACYHVARCGAPGALSFGDRYGLQRAVQNGCLPQGATATDPTAAEVAAPGPTHF